MTALTAPVLMRMARLHDKWANDAAEAGDSAEAVHHDACAQRLLHDAKAAKRARVEVQA